MATVRFGCFSLMNDYALGRWEFKHWHLRRLRNLNSVPSERFSKKTSLLQI